MVRVTVRVRARVRFRVIHSFVLHADHLAFLAFDAFEMYLMHLIQRGQKAPCMASFRRIAHAVSSCVWMITA